jgi:hypothetical protein
MLLPDGQSLMMMITPHMMIVVEDQNGHMYIQHLQLTTSLFSGLHVPLESTIRKSTTCTTLAGNAALHRRSKVFLAPSKFYFVEQI